MAAPADPTAPYRICVVCTGNICRSPMGEVILRSMLAEAGLSDEVVVDSAGTGDWHVGDPADRRTVAALANHGFDGTAHRASHFDVTFFAERDLVLVADRSHLRDVERMMQHAPGESEVRLLRENDDEAVSAGTLEVDDPYYGDDEDFERCLVEVERASAGVVRAVQAALATAPR